MLLHETLTHRREEVIRRWNAELRGTLAPASIPTLELTNHMPRFLGEIITALRVDAGLPASGLLPEESNAAAVHGAQRLRLGFSLDSVVREYGVLRDTIVKIGLESAGQITFRELQIVFDAIITGIAHAVSEFTSQRDAELVRQANEHFAFIAHELRNPLSSAVVALRLLKEQGTMPTGHSAMLLERALTQTCDLVEQTLQIARVSSGIELRPTETSVTALLKDVQASSTSEAEAKDIELRVTISQEEPIQVDVRLMRSAIGNLLRNAVKYTPPGHTIELRASVAQNRLTVEVEDACGGLEPGQVEKAFAPFVRMDESQGGFGLGLAIAKQAVDAHGGTIRVQNLPQKGCIFVLEIPTTPGR